jgi:hypothetical protein
VVNVLQFPDLDSFYHHAEVLLRQGVIFYGATATLTIVLLGDSHG